MTLREMRTRVWLRVSAPETSPRTFVGPKGSDAGRGEGRGTIAVEARVRLCVLGMGDRKRR